MCVCAFPPEAVQHIQRLVSGLSGRGVEGGHLHMKEREAQQGGGIGLNGFKPQRRIGRELKMIHEMQKRVGAPCTSSRA
jgi:hypothetical protein